jgi:hypothetical protein
MSLPNGFIQNGVNLFFRVNGSNSTCLVAPADQYFPLSFYPATNGTTLLALNDTFSGRYCVHQEFGLSQGLPDGFYQTPNTKVYKKFGHRGCALDSTQWSQVATPNVTQISQYDADQFNGGPCRSMELFTD